MVERLIISVILNEPKYLAKAYELLKPHHFEDSFCRNVYETLIELQTDDIPIDIITVYKKGKFNPVKISELATEFITTENFDTHIKTVYESYVKRESKRILDLQLKQLNESDVFDWLSSTTDKLFQVTRELDLIAVDKNIIEDIDPEIDKVVERATRREDGLESYSFPSLSKMTNGGFMFGNLVAVSGREKDGKTAFAYRLALDFAIKGNATAIFNYEVSKSESYWRLFGYAVTDAEYKNFRNPKENPINLENVRRELKRKLDGVNLFVYDKNYNETELVNKIKLVKEKYGIRIAVIDYIGLIPSARKYDTREKEIASLSRTFKQLAKELGMLFIVISQRNRQDDIAESLALQRDSDFALVVKNPTQYDTPVVKFRGQEIQFNEGEFFVYLSHSRHSVNGGYFKAIYNRGNFVELLEEVPAFI